MARRLALVVALTVAGCVDRPATAPSESPALAGPPVSSPVDAAAVAIERDVYVPVSPSEDVTTVDGVLPPDGHDERLVAIHASVVAVRGALAGARAADGGAATVACLSDKSAQLGVLESSARDRSSSLRTAGARGDTELAGHEGAILGVLRDRAAALEAEARACVR
jgi:hypothetical protein